MGGAGAPSQPHPYLYLLAKDSLQVYCVVNDRLKRRILKTKINCIGTRYRIQFFLKLECPVETGWNVMTYRRNDVIV